MAENILRGEGQSHQQQQNSCQDKARNARKKMRGGGVPSPPAARGALYAIP